MKPFTFLVAFLGLAACDAQVESRKLAVPGEQAAPAAAPLTAAGPAATVQPDTEEGNQWAAAVVELTPLTRQGDRTVKLFEEAGILEKLEFGDGRARYEDADRDHHDHLIDVNSGQVIEFIDPDIEELQERIAQRLGYRLIGHRLELLGVPLKKA